MNEHEAKVIRWAMVLVFLAWALGAFLPVLEAESEVEFVPDYPDAEQ
jgi:hypothetical protein